MRQFLAVLACIALTFFCWGIYGVVLHVGQAELGVPMQLSSLRPLICVGMAYFLIAVVVPIAWLFSRGEVGHWTASGAFWSLMAGVAGALGALGIILALKFRGAPVYVMPLVFGCAPVVNTFVNMAMTRTFREATPLFYIGVGIVALGAAGLMYFKPESKNVTAARHADGSVEVTFKEIKHDGDKTEEKVTTWTATSEEELKSKKDLERAYKLYQKTLPLSPFQMLMIPLSIGLTGLCWGSYGPVLHKGQMKMGGSRLRPFLCVGLAYFAIAVVVPVALMAANMFPEPGGWNVSGISWSLAGGAAGAFGALGIIMAFNFGGKPVYVMPLVFGCAPVVNTFATIVEEHTIGFIQPPFFVSLGLAILGAVMVLVFAPKPAHKPAAKPEITPERPRSLKPAAPPVVAEEPAPPAEEPAEDSPVASSEEAHAPGPTPGI